MVLTNHNVVSSACWEGVKEACVYADEGIILDQYTEHIRSVMEKASQPFVILMAVAQLMQDPIRWYAV